jgi:hypothetical protein
MACLPGIVEWAVTMSKGVNPLRVEENGEQPWVNRKATRVGGDIRAAWCRAVQPATGTLAKLKRAELEFGAPLS